MKTRPYPQIEEKPMTVDELAVAYGNITSEKLSPYTIEGIHDSNRKQKRYITIVWCFNKRRS